MNAPATIRLTDALGHHLASLIGERLDGDGEGMIRLDDVRWRANALTLIVNGLPFRVAVVLDGDA